MPDARILYEGPVLSGRTTTLTVLGWGDFRYWAPDAPDIDRAVRTVEYGTRRLVVDFGGGRVLYRTPLDPRRKGVPDTPYGLTRQDSLWRLDAIVFVADSQAERMEANLERLELLALDLGFVGRDPSRIPLVFQLNKRDLEVPTLQELRDQLRWSGPVEYVPSVATRGVGCADALRTALELVTVDE
jgi:hypothetical protein